MVSQGGLSGETAGTGQPAEALVNSAQWFTIALEKN